MTKKFFLALLVLGPALVFTLPIITPFELYITTFDRMYNKLAAKNPSANIEQICESIPKEIDDEVAQGIKFVEARNSGNKLSDVEEIAIDALKRTVKPTKESFSIMCKIKKNENDWATLKAAVAKADSLDKTLDQCFTDLVNELSGNPHVQREIKQWVKLTNEMGSIDAEVGEKIPKVRLAEIKEMNEKLMSRKIIMKDPSGNDLFNVDSANGLINRAEIVSN